MPGVRCSFLIVPMQLDIAVKTSLILQATLLVIVSYSSSCTPQKDDPTVKWKGPDDEVELVFFYKKGVSYEEKRYFQDVSGTTFK